MGGAILFLIFTVISGTIEMKENPLDPTSQSSMRGMIAMEKSSEPEASGFWNDALDAIRAIWHGVTTPIRWAESAWDMVSFNHGFLLEGGWTYARYLLFLPIGLGFAITIIWLLAQIFRRA